MEKVKHPEHYSGRVECIDAMVDIWGKDAVKAFCELNAFKYLWRSERKNGVEDIEKAIWYLKKRVGLEAEEEKEGRCCGNCGRWVGGGQLHSGKKYGVCYKDGQYHAEYEACCENWLQEVWEEE